MKLLLAMIIFIAISGCMHGDFSDRRPRGDSAPVITSSDFSAEFQEPSQPATGRRDARMIFLDANDYAFPKRRALVWGGFRNNTSGPNYLGNGAVFNPRTKHWRGVDGENIPQPRKGHSLVWTGDKIVVWGGDGGPFKLATGSSLDLTSMKWTPLSGSSSLKPRADHETVWQNGRMVVMGGCRDCPFSESYSPATDSWQKIQNPDGDVPMPQGLAISISDNANSGILYIEENESGLATGRAFHLKPNFEKWQNLSLNELALTRSLRGSAAKNVVFIASRRPGNSWKLFSLKQNSLELESIELPKDISAWKTIQHLQIADDCLTVFGGDDGAKMHVSLVKIGDIKDASAWKTIDSADAPLLYSDSVATVLEKTQVFIWGGESSGPEKYDAKGYLFDVPTRAWTVISDQP